MKNKKNYDSALLPGNLNNILRDMTNANNQLACLYTVIARASKALTDAGAELEHLSKSISTIHKTVSEANTFLAREIAFGDQMQ